MTNLEPVLTDDTTRRNFAKLEDLYTRAAALETSAFGGASPATGPAQARVFNNANISIPDTTSTALTFNSERYDNGSLHSTSVNTGRLTAPTAGLYSGGACVQWGASAVGVRVVEIRLNGTTVIAVEAVDIDSAQAHRHTVPFEYQFAATDYVEVVVTQNSGGPLNVTAAGNYSPEFWIHRVGSI